NKRTSPPWNGSETGEYGRRPGGGANKTDFSPVKRQWNGGERPKAGRVRERSGLLPREAAVERGSTAEGREGARAKRATKQPSTHGGPPDRAPSALTGHSPTPLTAPWGRNPKRPPDKSPGRRPGGCANEASQETTVDSRRSSGPRPLGPDGPLPHSANRSVGE